MKWRPGEKQLLLVKEAKLRKILREERMFLSKDFILAVDAELKNLVRKAAQRCSGNGRKILRALDL